MHTSDWIALAACIAAFLALIPAFVPLLTRSKSPSKTQDNAPLPNTAKDESASSATPAPPLNNFGTALVLTALALVIGVVEIVLFSVAARFFGVAVDVNSMPTNWLVVFYALFIIPGLLFFRAFLSITNMFH